MADKKEMYLENWKKKTILAPLTLDFLPFTLRSISEQAVMSPDPLASIQNTLRELSGSFPSSSMYKERILIITSLLSEWRIPAFSLPKKKNKLER